MKNKIQGHGLNLSSNVIIFPILLLFFLTTSNRETFYVTNVILLQPQKIVSTSIHTSIDVAFIPVL